MDRRTRLQSKYRAEEITTTTPHNDGTYNITGEKSKRSTKKKIGDTLQQDFDVRPSPAHTGTIRSLPFLPWPVSSIKPNSCFSLHFGTMRAEDTRTHFYRLFFQVLLSNSTQMYKRGPANDDVWIFINESPPLLLLAAFEHTHTRPSHDQSTF